MKIFPPHDGRILHLILHLHSWSEPQTLDAVLSPVTKHLSVVSCFMMCAVGLGICVWTVQARGFNCSLPLKLIQNHLDPLSAGTAWDLPLTLFQSGCLCLSPALVLSSLLIFPASLNYLVSLSFCCEGDMYVGVRVLRGYLLSGGNIWIQHNLECLLSKYITLLLWLTLPENKPGSLTWCAPDRKQKNGFHCWQTLFWETAYSLWLCVMNG